MSLTPLASSPYRWPVAVSAFIVLLAVTLGLTATNADAAPGNSDRAKVTKGKVTIKPHGLRKGRSKIMSTVTVGGNVKPYRANQRVRVYFFHNGKRYLNRSVKLKRGKGNYGTFKTSVITKKGGKYAVQAKYFGKGGNDPVSSDTTIRKSWKVRFVSLGVGQCGRVVRGFRKALNKLAFVPDEGKCFNGKMERAVLA
ncbi:MAG: hypothetical protein M3Y23_05575, partial [Actinomycetota bacterium]|nr:hypothetical protein [Actinomycetota bacterium]